MTLLAGAGELSGSGSPAWAGDPDPAGLSGKRPSFAVVIADQKLLDRYREIRRQTFCNEQAMFATDDADQMDQHPDTVSLVAVDPTGEVLGGVRVAREPSDATGAWWRGSRLALDPKHRGKSGVAASLVRAACSYVVKQGALRLDATVQLRAYRFFCQLGWEKVGEQEISGVPHLCMRWPIDRFERLVSQTKGHLGDLVGKLVPGGAQYVGDDAAPVPESDLLAATDAILASMVAKDPIWAGWCSVLVNMNDLAAMGASPLALLDSLGAPDTGMAAAVLDGMGAAARAWGVPIIGGHTQIGVPPSLSVTALGRAGEPITSGGGRPGHAVRLTADLSGCWRAGYGCSQWDSTSGRSPADLAQLMKSVATTRPAAAKDVGMAGIVGTLAALAEASGCGAELDLAKITPPDGARLADWLTCFPGFAMLSTDSTEKDTPPPLPPGAVSERCGRLVEGRGVRLLWPDGTTTTAVLGAATGLGPAQRSVPGGAGDRQSPPL